MNRLFVYGLLKPGYPLGHIAAPFTHTAEACWVRGRLYDAGVPAAKFDREGRIEGFLLRLHTGRLEEAYTVLDDVEDEGEVYRRVTVTVMTVDASTTAFAYEFLAATDGLLEAGQSWPLAGRSPAAPQDEGPA